jgi:hypothetical protein
MLNKQSGEYKLLMRLKKMGAFDDQRETKVKLRTERTEFLINIWLDRNPNPSHNIGSHIYRGQNA